MNNPKITLLALAVVLASCGVRGDEFAASTPPGGQQTHIVASPGAADEAQIGDVTYAVNTTTLVLSWSRPKSGDPLAITVGSEPLGGFEAQQIVEPGSAGGVGELWILGREQGGLELRAYEDSDADGVVETSTYTTVFSTTVGVLVGATAFDPVSGTLYLLQDDPKNIWRAEDTNADGTPDSFGAAAFAAADWSPWSPTPVQHVYQDPATGQTVTLPAGIVTAAHYLSDPTPTSVTIWNTMRIGKLEDTDADDVADAATTGSGLESAAPAFVDHVIVDGVWQLTVRGAPGASIAVQEVDALGVVQGTLATAAIDANDTSVTIVLASALSEGDWVRPYDSTSVRAGDQYKVRAARSVVFYDAVISVDPAVSSDFVLRGANLTDVDTVKFRRVGETAESTLVFTVSPDGRSLTATIPSGTDWDGVAAVQLWDDDPQPAVPVFSCQCVVCGESE